MKKRNFIAICIIIMAVVMSFCYVNLYRRYTWIKDDADLRVRSNLSVAAGMFGNNSTDDYDFNNSMSLLYSTSETLGYTDFKMRNELRASLDNLSALMKNPVYKTFVMKNSNLLYESLNNLSGNPNDEDALKKLDSIIEEIKLKK